MAENWYLQILISSLSAFTPVHPVLDINKDSPPPSQTLLVLCAPNPTATGHLPQITRPSGAGRPRLRLLYTTKT